MQVAPNSFLSEPFPRARWKPCVARRFRRSWRARFAKRSLRQTLPSRAGCLQESASRARALNITDRRRQRAHVHGRDITVQSLPKHPSPGSYRASHSHQEVKHRLQHRSSVWQLGPDASVGSSVRLSTNLWQLSAMLSEACQKTSFPMSDLHVGSRAGCTLSGDRCRRGVSLGTCLFDYFSLPDIARQEEELKTKDAIHQFVQGLGS